MPDFCSNILKQILVGAPGHVSNLTIVPLRRASLIVLFIRSCFGSARLCPASVIMPTKAEMDAFFARFGSKAPIPMSGVAAAPCVPPPDDDFAPSAFVAPDCPVPWAGIATPTAGPWVPLTPTAPHAPGLCVAPETPIAPHAPGLWAAPETPIAHPWLPATPVSSSFTPSPSKRMEEVEATPGTHYFKRKKLTEKCFDATYPIPDGDASDTSATTLSVDRKIEGIP